MGAPDEWVARDAAVVWHGFTQMASYAANRPVVVGRRLNRCLDTKSG